jgi:uncharacterized protein
MSAKALDQGRISAAPSPEAIGRRLADYCREAGIIRLKVFGSVARGEATAGSDVDLLATFASNPGLRFFAMAEEITAILGARVHLLTRDAVENLTNPYRRAAILAEATTVFPVDASPDRRL